MSPAKFDESYGANPAENYERFFLPSIGRPLAKELVDRARIKPADRVLDVACGTGIVARSTVQQVDGPGEIAGLDPNPGMLAVARKAANSPAIAWHEAAAEDMPLPDFAFDVVLCQMGLQFMSDQAAALQEMKRVLAGGGRLLLSVPGPITGIFAVLATAMEQHVGPPAAAFVRQVFALHDIEQLRALLQHAGFSEIVLEEITHVLVLPPPREFLWQYIHSTPLAGALAHASAGAQSRMEEEVLAAWTDHVKGDALVHELRLVMATGRKSVD